jgi:hypothetical protein
MSEVTENITGIKALRNTRASGEAIEAGKTYKVPSDVSLIDAKLLIRLKKAVAIDGKAVKDSGSGKDDGKGKGNKDK